MHDFKSAKPIIFTSTENRKKRVKNNIKTVNSLIRD